MQAYFFLAHPVILGQKCLAPQVDWAPTPMFVVVNRNSNSFTQVVLSFNLIKWYMFEEKTIMLYPKYPMMYN